MAILHLETFGASNISDSPLGATWAANHCHQWLIRFNQSVPRIQLGSTTPKYHGPNLQHTSSGSSHGWKNTSPIGRSFPWFGDFLTMHPYAIIFAHTHTGTKIHPLTLIPDWVKCCCCFNNQHQRPKAAAGAVVSGFGTSDKVDG